MYFVLQRARFKRVNREVKFSNGIEVKIIL